MLEDGGSPGPTAHADRPEEEEDDHGPSGGTLLHSILTDGPVYRRAADGRSHQSADLENGIDFGYSQKFFHIADGNLYSVFSPLQGRSYGGKPSFLRKQQCVVRESQGRGRKNPKRGLKFHNFLPSESITSEKEDKSLSGEGEIWKVHAECRLREEHGTKQIMVSNWSLSEGDPEQPQRPVDDDFRHLSLFSVSDAFRAVRLDSRSSSKGTELGAIVDRLGLVPRTVNLEHSDPTRDSYSFNQSAPSGPGPPPTEDSVTSQKLSDKHILPGGRKRRKPLKTRKVVPYHQYLSMLEMDESSPLDLSHRSPSPSALMSENANLPPPSDPSSGTLSSSETSVMEPRSERKSEIHSIPDGLTLHSPPIYFWSGEGLTCPTSSSLPMPSRPTRLLSTVKEEEKDRIKPPLIVGGQVGGPETEERRKTGRTRPRPNQRTAIRKKLEDTFRQNGFLVKTKQVSDGEATFCKFRQLKKYTRYYLKSWQEHLPEEVHKLWKGFLPPKTAIPSAGHGKREESKPAS